MLKKTRHVLLGGRGEKSSGSLIACGCAALLLVPAVTLLSLPAASGMQGGGTSTAASPGPSSASGAASQTGALSVTTTSTTSTVTTTTTSAASSNGAAGSAGATATEAGSGTDDTSTAQTVSLSQDFGSRGVQDPRSERDNSKHAFTTPFGQLAWPVVAQKLYVENGQTFVDQNGFKLKLTIDPDLQRAVLRNLETQGPISGAVVIIESKSGRVLAMAERIGSVQTPLSSDNSTAVAARAPAASLMKINTATAAMEKSGLEPMDEVPFRGSCLNFRNYNWLRDAARDRQHLTLARAFGSSCNTIFARLAIYSVGLSTLKTYADRYMFNRPIPSDFLIETSAALLPQLETATTQEVGEAGAGFGATKLSPVHAALLSAVAGNGGVMMAPYLVEEASDTSGKKVYTATPREISHPMTKHTSELMLRLMQETILSGTSRRYFRRRGTAADRHEIGGKTGTLSDAEDRSTLYTWFSGVAPLDSPENVAIGTLIASPQNWVVRASSVAQSSIAELLKLQKHAKRLANKTKY